MESPNGRDMKLQNYLKSLVFNKNVTTVRSKSLLFLFPL